MAKAVPLSINTMTAPQVTPQAATPPRRPAPTPEVPAAPKEKNVPLQLWLSPAASREIRIAAAQNDQKPSEYLLACHRAMQASKSG